MTLRWRITCTVFLTSLVLALLVSWVWTRNTQRSLERNARQYALGAMQSGGREVCRSFPESFPGPPTEPLALMGPTGMTGGRPPPEVIEAMARMMREEGVGPTFPAPPAARRQTIPIWAYRPDLTSHNPNAPALSEGIRARLDDAPEAAGEYYMRSDVPWFRTLVSMPWKTGPSAYILVDRPVPDHARNQGLLAGTLAGLCLALLGAILLAVGPVVRRVRRLERDVRSASESHYESPVGVSGRDEIAALATAFNTAGERVRAHLADIEARENTLRRFVENTTHDVGTPLTVVQGNLAALAEADPDDATLAATIEETQYIASLLHNLEAAARLDAELHAAAHTLVDLCAVVDRAALRHQTLARSRSVSLEHAVPEGSVYVLGDITLLEQAVSNLIHNAVTYNNSGGHVVVSVDRAPEQRFILRVHDDGPGATPEIIQRLTEPRFRSEEARTRFPRGQGLGLAIVRDVLERHALDLTIKNDEGGGLLVTVAGSEASPPTTAS